MLRFVVWGDPTRIDQTEIAYTALKTATMISIIAYLLLIYLLLLLSTPY